MADPTYKVQMKHRPRGFTLIEVLVVLIMVAMISGILFQAMQRAFGLQHRFGAELFKAQQGQMATDWYRQTVQGLIPDQPEGRNIFQGTGSDFSGLSSNPLTDDYGAPTPITWKIQQNNGTATTELVYVEDQRNTAVLTWREGKARFVYLDDQLAPHDSWPPPLGLFAQLPTQIRLELTQTTEPQVIVAAPMGPTETMLRPQDIFGIKP